MNIIIKLIQNNKTIQSYITTLTNASKVKDINRLVHNYNKPILTNADLARALNNALVNMCAWDQAPRCLGNQHFEVHSICSHNFV